MVSSIPIGPMGRVIANGPGDRGSIPGWVGKGAIPFLGLHNFTLDPYLIMLSVKQGGLKYHFLSLWYD